MNDLISVIVPIFNAEKYVELCIKSIINQTYVNFELLLIDDGSTDNSKQVCLDMQKKDKRIYYFYYDNEGVSAARNHGIEKSHGKYIVFVDADDMISPNMLQKIYSVRNKGELCQSLHSYVWNMQNTKKTTSSFETYDLSRALLEVISNGKVNGYVWGKLFQTEIIKENKIFFHQDISVCEDLLFCIEYLLNCNALILLNEKLYYYRIQNESVTRGENYFYKKTRLKAYKDIIEILKKEDISKDIISVYEKHLQKNRIYVCLDYFKYCQKEEKVPDRLEIENIFTISKIKKTNLMDFLLKSIFLHFITVVYYFWKRIHNEKNKSLTANAVLNGIRNTINLLFPLITFPYISRILGVEGIGKYNFSSSIINYFLLIAGLGISTYAIREGTQYRNDRKKIEKFGSEMLSLNLCSTAVSYILLILLCLYYTKMMPYKKIIYILSIQIFFAAIGIEWLYSIYENYSYITIRSIVVKIFSLILMLALVNKQEDINIYAGITVLASVGANIFNIIHARKYCKFHFTLKINFKKHMRPILTIFASNIAVMIYVYSDTTMLGLMQGDRTVGIYSVSVKIYNILKNLLSAILIVTIPRLSFLSKKTESIEFDNVVQKVIDSISLFLIPIVIGIFFMAKEIIIIISGKEYIMAVSSLRILSIALIFCIYGWIYNQCVLLTNEKENIILIGTVVSAAINILLNIILIPHMAENATALTTMIAELIMFIVCFKYGKKLCKAKIKNENNRSVFIASMVVAIVCCICKTAFHSAFFRLLSSVIISGFFYFIILWILKNKILIEYCKKIKNSFKNKKI